MVLIESKIINNDINILEKGTTFIFSVIVLDERFYFEFKSLCSTTVDTIIVFGGIYSSTYYPRYL